MESLDCSEASLTASQIDDLRLAAFKMSGATRRNYQAQMTLKYCDGNARMAERVFGWGRDNIEARLAEQAPSTMGVILNRMGYRLQPVVKAKPQKNSLKQTPSLTTSVQKTPVQPVVVSSD